MLFFLLVIFVFIMFLLFILTVNSIFKSLLPFACSFPCPTCVSLSRVRREIERAVVDDFLHVVDYDKEEDNCVAVPHAVETVWGYVPRALRV